MKAIHRWLTNSQRRSGVELHTIIGAVSASARKRSSLSRSAASARLRSVMSTITPRSSHGPPVDGVHGHAILEPDDAAVGGDHPVVELVVAARRGEIDAQLDRCVAIVGVDVRGPEVRVRPARR